VSSNDAQSSAVNPPAGLLLTYGEAPSAFGRLQVPELVANPPLVVLYHGGFWRRSGGDLNVMAPMADAFVERGYAVWNVEYGRTGERFGGWPYTFDHVAQSLEILDTFEADYGVDVSLPVLIGHSAGGHLALWAGANSSMNLGGVIALAPVVDLELAAENRLGNGAVSTLLGGGPTDVPNRYREASIVSLGSVPAAVITSSSDESVPAVYSIGVRGDRLIEHRLDSVEHLSMIRTDGETWTVITEQVEDFLLTRDQ